MTTLVLWTAATLLAGDARLPGDRVIEGGAKVNSIAFTSGGETIAGLCGDGKLRVWDARTGELKRTQALDKADKSLSLTPAGLSGVGPDGVVKFWNLQTGELANQSKPLAYKGGGIGIAPDRGKFASVRRVDPAGIDEAVHVWDAQGNESFTAASGFGGNSTMVFSPTGDALVAASYDTNVRVWQARGRGGELLKLIDELPVAMFDAAFSPDGKLLALAGADRIVYLYDAKTWTLSRKIAGQPEMIQSLAFSADGKLLVTGGFDVITVKHPVHVIVWDVESGKPIRTMTAPHAVDSVAFSADGKLGANVNGDQTVSVWAVPGR